jgi:tetratricopeptide (TPR) repeat protein
MLKIIIYLLISFPTNESLKSNDYKLDDYSKFRHQGDSLLKVCNYVAALKKYKSCTIFKEKDEYALTKIKTINDIINKISIAANLVSAGKNADALEVYRKILILNPLDLESIKNIPIILEAEAERKKNEGDDELAIQYLQEITTFVGAEKIKDLAYKIQQIKDKKKNPEYLKSSEEATKLMKAAKYPEAIKKFESIFIIDGFQKDKETQKLILQTKSFQQNKLNAINYLLVNDFSGVILELEKIIDGGINDTSAKSDIVKAYNGQADKLIKEGLKENAVQLLSKAIEKFDNDKKPLKALQKKLKEITEK